MLKTFRKGGTHPPDNKLTAGKKIESLPIPASVTIPLLQNIGAPALPVVNKGDKVLAGQVIAKADGYISANIHSSVSGTVSKIDTVPDSSGFKQTSVIIDVAGDEWIGTIDKSDTLVTDINVTPDEIIERCLQSGIVGMGGASFPTHVKLKVPAGKAVVFLL